MILLTIVISLIISIVPVNAQYVGAYGVTVTDEYVHVKYAKCSCIHSNGYHYYKNITFKNYCPMCKHKGTLYYEQAYSTNCPEGMWVCGYCDSDFCLVHGADHIYKPRDYLIHYIIKQKPKPEPESQPIVETPKDRYKKIVLQYLEYPIHQI